MGAGGADKRVAVLQPFSRCSGRGDALPGSYDFQFNQHIGPYQSGQERQHRRRGMVAKIARANVPVGGEVVAPNEMLGQPGNVPDMHVGSGENPQDVDPCKLGLRLEVIRQVTTVGINTRRARDEQDALRA